MEKNLLDAKALDTKALNEMLGNFCEATELHVEVVDNKGETFLSPGKQLRSPFCNRIRNSVKGGKKCRESYSRACQEAAKWEEPYFFQCHAGLVTWAVPIMIKGSTLGSIICGQVLMWKPDELFLKELTKLFPIIPDHQELIKEATQLPVISPERIRAAADMLFILVNYLITRNTLVLDEMESYRDQQQRIRKAVEEKKNHFGHSEMETYLKMERRLLRHVRLGDSVNTTNNLQELLAALYLQYIGDVDAIRERALELLTLIARASVEGGADAERVMEMLDNFTRDISSRDRVEEIYYQVNCQVRKFMEEIFVLADKKHLGLVNEARNFILENYFRPIKIEDVSSRLCISPSHLSRLFRQELNCTVNQYLTRVRIEKAVELMKHPELSVAEVAQQVGLTNQSYFTKLFRKYMGVNPLVYKNSLS